MKKTIFYLMLIMFIFNLGACLNPSIDISSEENDNQQTHSDSEKNGSVEFVNEKIEIKVGDVYLVEYTIVGDVEDIVFTVNNEYIATFENNRLVAHCPGTTTLKCTYNKNQSTEITVVVSKVEQTFDVGDPEVNEANYNQLRKQLDDFYQLTMDSNYVSVDSKIYINDNPFYETLRYIESPLYIESKGAGFNEIIAQEGENVFRYRNEYSGWTRDYIGNPEKNKLDINPVILNTTFDKSLCNVICENNIYTLTSYYSDLPNPTAKEIIKQYYSSISYFVFLDNYVTTLTYEFNEDVVKIAVSLIEDDGYSKNEIDLIYTISLAEFEPTDMLNSGISFPYPDCFEEVYEIYDFSKNLSAKSNSEIYLMVDVKKGMIVTKSEDVCLKLYDMDRNLVSSSMGTGGAGSYVELDSFLAVPEDGVYYLVVKNRISQPSHIDLEYYPYETVFEAEGIELFTNASFEGEIEGKYDFEKYIYNNSGDGEHLIRIDNKGQETIVVFHNEKWYSEGVKYVEPNASIYLNANKGYNEIYVCDDFTSSEDSNGYDYNISVSIYEFSFSGELHEGEIPSQFSLPSYKDVTYHTYLETGLHRIVSEDNIIPDDLFVTIYDENGNNVNANFSDIHRYFKEYIGYVFIEESGYYFVNIDHRNSSNPQMEYEYYSYNTKPDVDNPKIIAATNSGVLEGKYDFDYYELENSSESIKAYYLTNTSDFSIEIIMKRYPTSLVWTFILNPGEQIDILCGVGISSFFVTTSSADVSDLEYSFKIEEIINNNVTDMNSENIIEITQEFSDDYYLYGATIPGFYFKLVIEEVLCIRIEYKELGSEEVSVLNVRITTSDGKDVDPHQEIPPGEYYVRVPSTYGNLRFIQVKYTIIGN